MKFVFGEIWSSHIITLKHHLQIIWKLQEMLWSSGYLSRWWFQPIWKICSSKWESSPNRGENKKYLEPPSRWCFWSWLLLRYEPIATGVTPSLGPGKFTENSDVEGRGYWARGWDFWEKNKQKTVMCICFFLNISTHLIYIYLGPKVPLTKTKTLTMNHEVQHQCVRCVELQWWMFKANPTPSPRSRGFVALWRALPQVLTDFFECGKFVWQTFRASVDTNSQHQI